jgi:glutathione peroxidase
MYLSLILSIFLMACNTVSTRPEQVKINPDAMSFYDFKMNSIDGNTIDFNTFKGKKVLLVNTASACGYTPQYADLQKLHETHGDKVVILGIPANNFGGQEPGSNEQIMGFCSKNYGVTFQMLEKISVKGDDMHPLYKWLTDKEQNGWNDKAPNWNFCKYLISEDGKLLKFYGSAVKPMSEELISQL